MHRDDGVVMEGLLRESCEAVERVCCAEAALHCCAGASTGCAACTVSVSPIREDVPSLYQTEIIRCLAVVLYQLEGSVQELKNLHCASGLYWSVGIQ
jgi:hypothetical protein